MYLLVERWDPSVAETVKGTIAAPILVGEDVALGPSTLSDFVDDGTTLAPVLVAGSSSPVPLERCEVAELLEVV